MFPINAYNHTSEGRQVVDGSPLNSVLWLIEKNRKICSQKKNKIGKTTNLTGVRKSKEHYCEHFLLLFYNSERIKILLLLI